MKVLVQNYDKQEEYEFQIISYKQLVAVSYLSSFTKKLKALLNDKYSQEHDYNYYEVYTKRDGWQERKDYYAVSKEEMAKYDQWL